MGKKNLMVARFVPQRWNNLRRAIHSLRVGSRKVFKELDPRYSQCQTHVTRLNDAYDGQRIWKKRRKGMRVTVWRLK